MRESILLLLPDEEYKSDLSDGLSRKSDIDSLAGERKLGLTDHKEAQVSTEELKLDGAYPILTIEHPTARCGGLVDARASKTSELGRTLLGRLHSLGRRCRVHPRSL